MIITKIEKQKKNRGRYNIHLDGDFAFGLYEETVLKFGLRTGDEIPDEKISEMKEFDEIGFGKKTAYAYLSYKPRSKKELSKKLKQKKISAPSIEKILQLLESQKYIDDESYARNYLDSRLRGKAIGKRLAKIKLFEKGIDKDLAEDTIAKSYSGEKEAELAAKLLAKYEKKVKYKDADDKKKKCVRYLISRGFGFETVSKVLKSN